MRRPTCYDWLSVTDRKDWWMLDLAWFPRVDCIVNRDPDPTGATVLFPVEVLEFDQLPCRLLSRSPLRGALFTERRRACLP